MFQFDRGRKYFGGDGEKLQLTSRTRTKETQSSPERRDDESDLEESEPNKLKSRIRWLVFIATVVVLFVQAGRYASRLRSYAEATSGPWLSTSQFFSPQNKLQPKPYVHPITKLMDAAEETFRSMMDRQSPTLAAAVAEYERRYHRAPPRGFDDWWDFAVEHDVAIIDEYDGLMEDLEPFWSLSGEEMRRRAVQIGRLRSVDIVSTRDGKLVIPVQEGHEDIARAKGFKRMLEKYADKLPDLDFPINAKAEGRILVPWEHLKYPNMTNQNSSGGIVSMLGGEFIEDWRGDGNVWESFRRTCDPSSQARRLFGSIRTPPSITPPNNYLQHTGAGALSDDDDFKFAEALNDKFDYCAHPWAHFQQGHFFSDWRTIPVLYPIFSPAKAPGFSDIRIPSHYYYAPTKRYAYGWDPVNLIWKDSDEMEKPWTEKADDIFWRGATTGGGNAPPGFSPQYQRHRFLRMTSDKSDTNKTVVFADPDNPTNYIRAEVPINKLNDDIMETAFVNALDYKTFPGGIEAMHRIFRFGNAVPLGEHWSHKYLPDLDGMGYSGRFFAFLHSESAVIKSTVYREFFSDWLQPWLHYIPLSSSYKELYNIHAYFSGPSPSMLEGLNITSGNTTSLEGDRRLRRIARAGRQWRLTMGRPIDMDAYVYRLCLEYARLSADDRDDMNFSL